LLYLIIFVPYNLFRLFLVHKILASKYICENGKKKREKKKRRNFPTSWAGGGDFGPDGASARRRARFRPTWPSRAGQRRGNGAAARARTPERGGRTALTARREGRELDRGPVGGEPRGGSLPSVRFCGGETVAKHGQVMGVGRILPAGGLWRPVHGTVVGAHGGDSAGEVAGHNRVGEVASCDRESVAELLA
jgi:hypothetical protein